MSAQIKRIRHESLNAELGAEFDRYVVEHPDFAARIPKSAIVILQLEGDPGFNRWVKKISLKHIKGEKPVVYVKVKGLMPVPSRLKKPVSLEIAALRPCGPGSPRPCFDGAQHER